MKIKTEARQEIVLTLALREALSILAMPLPSLAEWLQEQIEQNPALQFDEKKFESEREIRPFSSSFPEGLSSIEQVAAHPMTLHDYLLQQAREAVSSPEDLKEMEILIGNLDEKGFIGTYPAPPKFLQILQSFDPPGIGAIALQHSLLLQLERKGEKGSLAYRLIQDHYEDLLHKRNEIICQKLPCTKAELQSVIDNSLAILSLNPAAPFEVAGPPIQPPDIFIELLENRWSVTLNDFLLPKFYLNTSSSSAMSRFESSAHWIQKMLSKRGEIITKMTLMILERQSDFFYGKTSDLEPLTFRDVAEKLGLHESTISRAAKDKYLSCPRGIFELRFFFSQKTATSTISCYTAKERLKALIQMESKQKPFSDEALAKALCKQGIQCARRTITKYRKSLKIPSASGRKR